MAAQAMTRECIRVLWFLMNVVTGGACHFARGEALALLQRADLVAMYIWRCVGSGRLDRQVVVNIIARYEGERRPDRLDGACMAQCT